MGLLELIKALLSMVRDYDDATTAAAPASDTKGGE